MEKESIKENRMSEETPVYLSWLKLMDAEEEQMEDQRKHVTCRKKRLSGGDRS